MRQGLIWPVFILQQIAERLQHAGRSALKRAACSPSFSAAAAGFHADQPTLASPRNG